MLSAHATHRSSRVVDFTLVELMVVLGILFIALGLSLPALRNARAQADRVRLMSDARQAAIMVGAYCAAHDGHYPSLLPHKHPGTSRAAWPDILVKSGYMEPAERRVNIFVGPLALNASPFQMMKGRTLPWERLRLFAVDDSMVKYPSLKGMLWAPRPHGEWWCCDPSYFVKAPIAMADGSAIVVALRELLPPGQVAPQDVVDGIGIPVDTTWDGCYGRDRN